jgi:hypothetical protein
MAVTLPHVPLFIPAEICTTVGLPITTPPAECLNQVRVDVGDDGISAPKDTDVAGLRQVLDEAGQQGIDLKVVVVPNDPPIEAPLRDVATEIGHAYPGSTVLVVSPNWAGTYSTTYDRVVLEAGQDLAKGADNPVQATKDFVAQLQTPDFPWTALTIALVVGVALATVLTRVLQVRGRRRETATADDEPAASPTSPQ